MAKNYQRRSSADSRANAHQPASKQLKSSVFQDNRHETALQRELKDLVPNQPKSSPAVTQQVAQCQIDGVEEQTPYDITDLINKYNLLDDQATLSTRMSYLSNIEHAIYAWLIKNTVPDVSNNKLIMHVRSLMDAAKTERNRIVAESINRGDHEIDRNTLPIAGFDLLDEETKNEVRKMWNDLVERNSNIKITNTEKILVVRNDTNQILKEEFEERTHEGFILKILTEFSRLLEGEYGRKIVKAINKSTKMLEIEPYMKENRKKSLGVSKKEGSFEEGDSLRKLTSAPDNFFQEQYPEHTIKNEIERINFFNDLKPLKIGQLGVKVIDGDTTTYYQFGPGTDITMSIPSNLDDSSLENDSRLINEDGQELVTPVFILLGHEMGHGIRMQQGTALGTLEIPHLLPSEEVRLKYGHNREEYVNINGTENQLRNDHKLGKREGHGSIPYSYYYNMIKDIYKLIDRIKNYKNIQGAEIVKTIINYINDLKVEITSEWNNPKLLPDLRNKFSNLENKIKNMEKNHAEEFVLNYLSDEINEYKIINQISTKFISNHNKSVIINLLIYKINSECEEIKKGDPNFNYLNFLNEICKSRSEFIDTHSEVINKIIFDKNNTEIKELEVVKKCIVKFTKAQWLYKK
jgi:hypothetical protein